LMGDAGEMHDRLDPCERPAGLRSNIAHRTLLDRRRKVSSLSNRCSYAPATLRELSARGAADKARRTGDQNRHHLRQTVRFT
jgi:hypothetical protein